MASRRNPIRLGVLVVQKGVDFLRGRDCVRMEEGTVVDDAHTGYIHLLSDERIPKVT